MTVQNHKRLSQLKEFLNFSDDGYWLQYQNGYKQAEQDFISKVDRLTEALEWIMPKVHQGNHEGEFESCKKATCTEYRHAMEYVRGE